MSRLRIAGLTLSLLVLAGCGGDGGAAATDGAPPDVGSTSTATPAGDAADEQDAVGGDGGTILVDGTTYAFVADRWCDIHDELGQYYISGALPDVEDGGLNFIRDDGRHTISVDLADATYRTFQEEIESTIDGNVVTGTARLVPEPEVGLPEGAKSEPLQAEFRFEC